jgi:signal transduction histidine kinase
MSDLRQAKDYRAVQLDFTDLAFVLVVLASYASMIVVAPEIFQGTQLIVMLLLGGLYAFLGTIVWHVVDVSPSLWIRLLYFGVQLILGGMIVHYGSAMSWLVLLPLVSHAMVALPRRLSWPVIGLILLAEIFPFIISGEWSVIFTAGLSLGAAVLFVGLFTQITINERDARADVERLAQELGQANRKLSEYALQVEELAVAEERNRLAREIHDGLGHYLTSINIQIQAAQAVLESDPEQASQLLGKARALSQDSLSDIRRSVAALRAAPTETKSLPESLRDLVEENRVAGLAVQLEVLGAARPLPAKVELALFRASQEGLTNVRKHAGASQAELRLDYSQAHYVRLSLRDNGGGAQDTAGGFGLLGVRERARLLGGVLDIQTSPGEGFLMQMELPLEA